MTVPRWAGPGCRCGEERSAHRGSHGAAVWGHAGAPGRGRVAIFLLLLDLMPGFPLGPKLPTRPTPLPVLGNLLQMHLVTHASASTR